LYPRPRGRGLRVYKRGESGAEGLRAATIAASGGQDLDLTPVLPRGAVASGGAENLAAVERISELGSCSFLAKLLASLEAAPSA
jgi:hypothetical protein